MVLCFVVHPRFLEHCVVSCLHLRCLSKGLREGSLSFFPCTASMFLVLCWLSTLLLLVSALVCDLGGLYAQVLPNMLCNWLRLKENESRCHQNNLWTNHFVTLQCILCPPEMHQKTYITAYHVASNADNEQ
uniref:Uncharacterized protein n=1 Tax=Populus trichocarpa TaxID=3694 RepID=A0A3N7G859_POPTR